LFYYTTKRGKKKAPYPFGEFYGIKGMKGNTSSMVLTAGNILQLRQRAKETGSTARAQDRETFLAYLLPVKKHLYNFVQKTSNFSSDADDIFQDTLLKAFRYFHSFDHGKNFKTWIFTIAHNLMKDAFQEKQLRHWPVSLEEMGEIAADEDQTKTARSYDVREIYTTAAALKPRHREVFFIYYYNEFNISEIIEITGLSRANIKFMLHQARKAIQKVMEVQV
jgi:RNA polymerase sigma-70 factor (ECF subfamily)